MNADDLLSFKEYSPVDETHTQMGGAEINVNSPNRQRSPYQNATTTSQQSTLTDPLQDLINSMSASVNVIQSEDRQRSPSDDLGDGQRTNHSIFSLEYYQRFFNVDASIVYERIVSAIVPRRAPVHYMKQDIGPNPNLYGSFWIVVTLVFSIAISGNIASYLQEANPDYRWKDNFHLVSAAATTIVIYVILIPFALWAAFKWTARPVDSDLITDENGIYTPSLLALICIYGYSLGIYIPVSVLWVIQISFLQWGLVFGAALSTGAVLIIILSPALQNSTKSVFLIGGILLARFLLATGFMLHFFHMPSDPSVSPTVQSPDVWMCGGSLQMIQCSRVGHIFRKKTPYTFPGGGANYVVTYNSNRLANVWIDDWIEFYYLVNVDRQKTKSGDVSKRIDLRKSPNCNNFKWYKDNIYP